MLTKTILIVDDSISNLDILSELLIEYDVIDTTSGADALEIVKEEKIDLILLDIVMPEIGGYEICEILKSNPDTKDIPIVFLTAKTDEDSIEKAYEIGGNDYIAKPLKPKELLARVKMQLELQSLIQNLEYMSSYDSMTNIYNRRKFFELAEYKFDSQKDNLFAVMIDIDSFKNINDTYGHDIGDNVIKTIIKTIQSILPEDSVFGRLGGEEFAIVCNHENETKLYDLIELMRKKVDESALDVENETIHFSISVGIAKYQDGTNALDELLKEADKLLYEAKDTGRNKIIFKNK